MFSDKYSPLSITLGSSSICVPLLPILGNGFLDCCGFEDVSGGVLGVSGRISGISANASWIVGFWLSGLDNLARGSGIFSFFSLDTLVAGFGRSG